MSRGVLTLALSLVLPTAFSAEPLTIDDLGFNSVTDSNLFGSRFQINTESESVFSRPGGLLSVRTTLEAEEPGLPSTVSSLDNLDYLTRTYQSQGLKITRLSTSWRTESGTLTVGNNWTNFKDILHDSSGRVYTPRLGQQTADQVTWSSQNGLSISIEDPADSDWLAADDTDSAVYPETSPNLVLAWQGGPGGHVGKYRLAALGRKLEFGTYQGNRDLTDSEIGWGLNLSGGWRFGDLFAALSVTVGNGIDSLLFGRRGKDLVLSSEGQWDAMESFGIQPSLNYSLTPRSNFHVALGHYESTTDDSAAGDTLDTIHLGYSWKPWPSTNFGLAVTGKDGEGSIRDQDSAEVTIGAQKRF